MPYYCTVPRCTSMAGKAKNVSFHQFPRDEELAKLWNRILKRGKPYTKYSKVCSLHFKPEDYTVTSVGKNKGQWRTLRKDAVPSQNLPSDSPAPYTRRHSSAWVPSLSPNLVDPMVQQQMAQAIYMQTMLAMQTASTAEPPASNDQITQPELCNPSPSGSSLSEIEQLLRRTETEPKEETYRCQECSKCFKDPDVFILHKRVHTKNVIEKLPNIEKENYSANIQDSEETLRANPILANLLKSSMRLEPESNLETNVLTIENQIMSALTSNMEAYIRTLSSMLTNQTNTDRLSEDLGNSEDVGNDYKEDSADDYKHDNSEELGNDYKDDSVDGYKHEDKCGESDNCQDMSQSGDNFGGKSDKCDGKDMHSDEPVSGDEVRDDTCDEKDAYQHLSENCDAVNESGDVGCQIKDQVDPDCDSYVEEMPLNGLN